MKTIETVGKQAEAELTEILGKASRLYRPEILEKCHQRAIRIASSYEEFLAWWDVDAYIREGFEVDNHLVTVPCFFTLVSEVKSTKDFSELRIEEQTNIEKGIVYFSSFYMLERQVPTDNLNSLDQLWSTREAFVEKIISLKLKTIDRLQPDRQKAFILAALATVEFWMQIAPSHLQDLSQVELFMQLIHSPERIIEMFAERDYQKTPPKCIVYHRQKKSTNALAVLRLLFIHFLAFDILIMTNGQQGSIHPYLDSAFFDQHRFQSTSINPRGLKWQHYVAALIGVGALISWGILF